MTGGGSSDDPPIFPPSTTADGEFLLRLLHSRFHQSPSSSSSSPNDHHDHNLSIDPAISAVGPSLPHHHRHHSLSPPSPNPNIFLPHHYQQNNSSWAHQHKPSPPSFYTAPHQHFRQQTPPPASTVVFGNIPFSSSSSSSDNYNNMNVNKKLGFEQDYDLFEKPHLGFNLGSRTRNGSDLDSRIDPRFEPGRGGVPPGFTVPNSKQRRSLGDLNHVVRDMSSSSEFEGGVAPGISMSSSNERRSVGDSNNVVREMRSGGGRELGGSHRRFPSRDNGVGVLGGGRLSGQLDHFGFNSGSSNGKEYDRERRFGGRDNGVGVRVVGGERLSGQLEHPGLPAGSAHRSVLGSDIEQTLKVLHGGERDNGVGQDEIDELSEQLVDAVLEEESADGKGEISANKKHHRDKDFRSDARGKWILPQRMRNSKRLIECRRDIHRLNAPLVAIYDSLIPPEEEKTKQKQLMSLLGKLVSKEWPNAKLFLYGSCANSFGVSKSDIDVCLAIDDQDINKSEILLKLADILQAENFQNVQALTRARVPIVKLMDPVTGISCDICINNVLAVVNTKLLRDYADIDVRLRQLAFLVKHWAKSRGVNETYQGTLSSYAYVLMCIHFLQQRSPPILPCLQGMKATYVVTVDDIECAFFDQVEKLDNFGGRNKESIAELMWGFFGYWAYCHDYTNSVISIRTGSTISKHEKDWTRRVGNDRHLICIEDPFEISHDLGRVVDKHSIRVLREEFERAAYIMQYDPNPCVALFEPHIPN